MYEDWNLLGLQGLKYEYHRHPQFLFWKVFFIHSVLRSILKCMCMYTKFSFADLLEGFLLSLFYSLN